MASFVRILERRLLAIDAAYRWVSKLDSRTDARGGC